ncbi:MAG: hypothetical protein KatS3mg034_0623 [Vicingaceae bacterium]|nr:MAG: hypothetical protein KatS3mg034_0623 [Vicingaceae bacterium]
MLTIRIVLNAVLIFYLLYFNTSYSQTSSCFISSNCGYTVKVDITPVSIVPSTNNCPYGYNYNVQFNYSITINGNNTCYNDNIGIQPQIFCNNGQNNGYYTINVPAPNTSSPPVNQTYSGTLVTTTNQYRNQSDCNTASPSSLGCNTVQITIYGPGIPTQTISCNNTPLPITLLNFEAEVNNFKVFLKWATASEINNEYFIIEKSIDGYHWEFIEKIKGAGNSHSINQYQAIDESPYFGTSYYRLKQTDFNGDFSYSEIVAVTINYENKNFLKIYPNPTFNILNIHGQTEEIINFKIFNLLGQDVSNFVTIEHSSGNNIIVNISQLPKGTYFIHTNTQINKILKI